MFRSLSTSPDSSALPTCSSIERKFREEEEEEEDTEDEER